MFSVVIYVPCPAQREWLRLTHRRMLRANTSVIDFVGFPPYNICVVNKAGDNIIIYSYKESCVEYAALLIRRHLDKSCLPDNIFFTFSTTTIDDSGNFIYGGGRVMVNKDQYVIRTTEDLLRSSKYDNK